MKKTLFVAAAAGLALSSGIEETQDNELVMGAIKNGYYTATNWVLANPVKVNQAGIFIANGLMNPKWDDEELMAVVEADDDEFMAKGHGHGQGHEKSQKQKGDKKGKKDGKKPRPQPQPQPQPEAPVDQVQDNNLAVEDFQDDELVMGAIKNGYYGATNWVLQNPVKIHQAGNFIANGLMNPRWDDEELMAVVEADDDEFMAKGHGQGHEKSQKQKGKKNKDGKKPRPQPQPQPEAPVDQVQDNNLAVEDFQDDELVMGAIKNGYYGATNWVLQNPVKIHQAGNFIANGLMNPRWDDEELMAVVEADDDEFMAKGHGQGHEKSQKQKGKKNKDGKKPRPQPQPEAPVDQVQDNNLAVEDFQDDELVMGAIKNGYYTATNWVLANPVKVNQAGIFLANGLMNPKWDDEELMAINEADDDEFAAAGEKTEKPKRKRQPLERPDDKIKKNTRLRVPKEAVADNTLFDLAELLEDN